MLSLELLQKIPLLLLVTRQPALLLLSLIIHHLLDHSPSLPIQIAQIRRLRRDLTNVDLGRTRNDMSPPFHLVDLIQMHRDFFAGRMGGCFEGPGGFVCYNGMREWALVYLLDSFPCLE